MKAEEGLRDKRKRYIVISKTKATTNEEMETW